LRITIGVYLEDLSRPKSWWLEVRGFIGRGRKDKKEIRRKTEQTPHLRIDKTPENSY